MTTAIPVLEDKKITLNKDGHQLIIQVKAPGTVKMKTWPTLPANGYDAPNPGTTLVGFEIQMKPSQKQTIRVCMIPDSSSSRNIGFKKRLINW